MDVKINIDRLNAKVAEAFPKHLAAQESKAKDPNMVAAGFAGLPGTGGIDTAVLTFCAAWPKVRPLLNVGLKFASWFFPATTIALAKSVIEAINGEIVPAICGPQAAAK